MFPPSSKVGCSSARSTGTVSSLTASSGSGGHLPIRARGANHAGSPSRRTGRMLRSRALDGRGRLRPDGGGPAVLDVAKMAVDAARRRGADFADARAGTDESESLTVRNQEMEGIDRSTSTGVGVRVLVGGRWGFAATSRLEPAEIERTARSPSRSRRRRIGFPATPSRSPPSSRPEPGAPDEGGSLHRAARGEGGPLDGGLTPDAVGTRAVVRGSRARLLPAIDVVRLERRRRDRAGRHELRRGHRGDRGRRRRHATTELSELVPGACEGGRLRAHPHLGPDRGSRAHRPGGRGAALRARMPERGHDAGARLRPDGAADPRVDRPPDRARPRARHGGGLRRVVLALPRRPG